MYLTIWQEADIYMFGLIGHANNIPEIMISESQLLTDLSVCLSDCFLTSFEKFLTGFRKLTRSKSYLSFTECTCEFLKDIFQYTLFYRLLPAYRILEPPPGID